MNSRNAIRGLVALVLLAGAFSWSCSSPSTEPQTVRQTAETPEETKPQPVESAKPVDDDKSVATAAPGSSSLTAKRADYAPHVTIDWSVPQVEIAARVALREGLLELLMCRTGTKEHESVLVTDADPQRIHEALGLIGLVPGNPMQYDPQHDRYIAPTGQRLALEIRYEQAGTVKTVAAHEWMAASENLTPVKAPQWLFCGSRMDGGRYLASEDGTIACVVDFDTSVIGLAQRHSADNEELWLAANTKDIPEKGTPCTLVVRALAMDPIVAELTPESYFAIGGKVIDALQLDALIKERIKHYPEQELRLSPASGTPNDFARVAGRCIIGSGIAAENLTLTLHPEESATPADSSPAPEKASDTQNTG